MKTPLLIAQNITKVFSKSEKKISILNGINLAIYPGQKIAIVGASGAGKSTLLHILGGIEPPSTGSVLYSGENIFRYSEKKRAQFRNQHLGFIFQFHHLLPELTTLENVLMPALIGGHSKTFFLKKAQELLDLMGLSHRASHFPSELSGGEQQRTAIARALLLQPQLLLADEPTGNLDSANRTMILNLLIELNHVTKVAILLVTHDMVLAGKMETICHMQDGAFFNEASV
jgi:lipoprotein-releasing system ATP-binding protein